VCACGCVRVVVHDCAVTVRRVCAIRLRIPAYEKLRMRGNREKGEGGGDGDGNGEGEGEGEQEGGGTC
jgi:hypothetical protein